VRKRTERLAAEGDTSGWVYIASLIDTRSTSPGNGNPFRAFFSGCASMRSAGWIRSVQPPKWSTPLRPSRRSGRKRKRSPVSRHHATGRSANCTNCSRVSEGRGDW